MVCHVWMCPQSQSDATIGYGLAPFWSQFNSYDGFSSSRFSMVFISQIFILTCMHKICENSKNHIVKTDARPVPPRTREIPPLTRPIPSLKFWGFHKIYESFPLWVLGPTFIKFMKAILSEGLNIVHRIYENHFFWVLGPTFIKFMKAILSEGLKHRS